MGILLPMLLLLNTAAKSLHGCEMPLLLLLLMMMMADGDSKTNSTANPKTQATTTTHKEQMKNGGGRGVFEETEESGILCSSCLLCFALLCALLCMLNLCQLRNASVSPARRRSTTYPPIFRDLCRTHMRQCASHFSPYLSCLSLSPVASKSSTLFSSSSVLACCC